MSKRIRRVREYRDDERERKRRTRMIEKDEEEGEKMDDIQMNKTREWINRQTNTNTYSWIRDSKMDTRTDGETNGQAQTDKLKDGWVKTNKTRQTAK